jgi:DNA-binding response OmpR family regulator
MAKKILIVEDDLILLKAMSAILQKEGYQVYTAPGGSEALTALQQKHYDLVLLDLVLPRVSGFELLSRIKEAEGSKRTPVIIVSSLSYSYIEGKQTRNLLRDTAYLPKPFGVADLLQQVDELIA